MSPNRYPWTYAADFIRAIPDTSNDDFEETKLSREEATRILRMFAEVCDFSAEDLAVALAERFLADKKARLT